MITGIDSQKTALGSLAAPSQNGSDATAFDAALQAAQSAQAKDQARQSELQAIRDTGFRKWVGEQQVQKVKEELRKKIMQGMGLTEEDLAKMAPAVRQILEQKIQQAIEQQMQEELKKQQAEKEADKASQVAKNSSGVSGQASNGAVLAQAAGGQNQTQQKDKDGKTCLVIPALAWPGLGPQSLF